MQAQVVEIIPYVLLREGEQKEFTFSEVEFILILTSADSH